MSAAISICARNTIKEAIEGLWRDAGRFELEPSMLKLDYPPHFTFAIYDEIESDVLHRAAESVFSLVAPLRITFNSIRRFDVSPLVLWASPANIDQLTALHDALHRQISSADCREHYLPGNWIPHCTIATAVADERRDAALSFAAQELEPFDVVFDSAECVIFPPIELTHCITLG